MVQLRSEEAIKKKLNYCLLRREFINQIIPLIEDYTITVGDYLWYSRISKKEQERLLENLTKYDDLRFNLLEELPKNKVAIKMLRYVLR